MSLAAYKQFLAQFGEMPAELMNDVVIQGKRIFHDPQHNNEWCAQHGIKPHSVGMFLGEQKREFQPTPTCLERISEHSDAEAIVDAKGAWLFLCGRDIFGKAVKSGKPQKGKPVFLYDQEHNLLGYGIWANDVLKPNAVVIAHKADRGVYLRRR